MLIWGEKTTTRKLGFVAERCPKCRSTTVVELRREGVALHVFWIPLGRGRLLGYYGVCASCGGELPVGPTDYLALEKKRPEAAAEIVAVTSPRLLPGERSAADAHERFCMLRAPLLAAEQSLQERSLRGTHFDRTSGVAFALALVLPGLLSVVDTSGLHYRTQAALASLAGWLFFGGIITGLVLMIREPRRYFRRELEPWIVEALEAAQPRRDELEDCLRRLRRFEYLVVHHISADGLLERMRARRYAGSRRVLLAKRG